MKKLLVAAIFMACVNGANACDVPYQTTDGILEQIHANGGWQVPDEICVLLTKNDVSLSVKARAIVENGTAGGWAAVEIRDPKLNISSLIWTDSAKLDTSTGSSKRADQLMAAAINDAIRVLDVQSAIQQIEKFRSLRDPSHALKW